MWDHVSYNNPDDNNLYNKIAIKFIRSPNFNFLTEVFQNEIQFRQLATPI